MIAEATAVAPEGRISPGCTGLWNDTQAQAWAPIVKFVKRHGAVPGIQIAHAGRKAVCQSAVGGRRPHATDRSAIVGARSVPRPSHSAETWPRVPHELTKAEILRVQGDFVAAAKRALESGFEWLVLHFAHGYLAQSFFSPIANKRTDEYGGSFENRARFLIDTLKAVRAIWPENLPLTIRLGVSDFTRTATRLEESIQLVKEFKQHGLDVIDVSLGFNSPDVSGVPWGPAFMAPIAQRIKAEDGAAYCCGLVHQRAATSRRHHRARTGGPRDAGAQGARRSALSVSRGEGARRRRAAECAPAPVCALAERVGGAQARSANNLRTAAVGWREEAVVGLA